MMNNTQLYLAIGLPMMTVLLTWLASRAELNRNVDRLDRSIETLRADIMRESAGTRSELVAIRNDHHKDLVALMGYMVPLHERMAKLEAQK
jgi:hypothetical protein